MSTVTYIQLNKDNAYWSEKIVAGKQDIGGHTSGLLTYKTDDGVQLNVVIDAGLGTIEALCDLKGNFDWDAPLAFLVTHGHPDHHLELMILSELHCKRMSSQRKDPVPVYCTRDTYEKWLKPVHGYGFEGGNTLAFKSVYPVRLGFLNSPAIRDLKPFFIHAVEVDHFPGSVVFVIEFGEDNEHKILIGWDLQHLPDPDIFPVLKNPSLALVEANTLEPSPRSGHTSATDLCSTGFLQKLNAPQPNRSVSQPPYGVFFVHFGGRPDENLRNYIDDTQFFQRVQTQFQNSLPTACVGMAKRLQKWIFTV